MLRIIVPAVERWIDDSNEIGGGHFYSSKEQVLLLEHSLISVSKWEAKWHQPFLDDKKEKTLEQTLDYIRCMTLNTDEITSDIYMNLSNNNIEDIKDYMDNSMTATVIKEKQHTGPKSSEYLTNEIIYYQMIILGIPFECENWHLNRLITLIKVCAIKQTPQKKMSQKELMDRNRNLNASRKAALHTRG